MYHRLMQRVWYATAGISCVKVETYLKMTFALEM